MLNLVIFKLYLSIISNYAILLSWFRKSEGFQSFTYRDWAKFRIIITTASKLFFQEKNWQELAQQYFFLFIKIGYKIGNRKIRNTNSLDFKLMRFYISEDPWYWSVFWHWGHHVSNSLTWTIHLSKGLLLGLSFITYEMKIAHITKCT